MEPQISGSRPTQLHRHRPKPGRQAALRAPSPTNCVRACSRSSPTTAVATRSPATCASLRAPQADQRDQEAARAAAPRVEGAALEQRRTVHRSARARVRAFQRPGAPSATTGGPRRTCGRADSSSGRAPATLPRARDSPTSTPGGHGGDRVMERDLATRYWQIFNEASSPGRRGAPR